jgi:hypothetical protein
MGGSETPKWGARWFRFFSAINDPKARGVGDGDKEGQGPGHRARGGTEVPAKKQQAEVTTLQFLALKRTQACCIKSCIKSPEGPELKAGIRQAWAVTAFDTSAWSIKLLAGQGQAEGP